MLERSLPAERNLRLEFGFFITPDNLVQAENFLIQYLRPDLTRDSKRYDDERHSTMKTAELVFFNSRLPEFIRDYLIWSTIDSKFNSVTQVSLT